MYAHILYLAALFLTSAVASPQFNPKDAVIVLQENDFNGVDPWHWRYETSDGTFQEQQGSEADGAMVRGRYSWAPPDVPGAVYDVTYTADAKGYVARVVFGTRTGAGTSALSQPLPATGGASLRSGVGGTAEMPPQPANRAQLSIAPKIGLNSQLTLIG